jgi:hypothetical protein
VYEFCSQPHADFEHKRLGLAKVRVPACRGFSLIEALGKSDGL